MKPTGSLEERERKSYTTFRSTMKRGRKNMHLIGRVKLHFLVNGIKNAVSKFIAGNNTIPFHANMPLTMSKVRSN